MMPTAYRAARFGIPPARLNRPIGLALSLVRQRPFCPFCAEALRSLNAARGLAKAGWNGLVVWWVVRRAEKQLRRANQTDAGQNRLPPSEDRWKQRSITYPGIAAAIATQWGRLILTPAEQAEHARSAA